MHFYLNINLLILLMKVLHYIFFIIRIQKVELYFLKNRENPKCINCKFFIPNKNECSNFGDIDIVTNEYTYEKAIDVRNDYDKCGIDAIFYKKNYLKFITIPYYFLLENKDTLIFLLSMVSIAIFPYFIAFIITR